MNNSAANLDLTSSRSMLRLLFTTFLLLMFSNSAHAATSPDNIWQDLSGIVTAPDSALNINAVKARELTIDSSRLGSLLASAPVADPNSTSKPAPITLYLPDPRGGFVEFEIRRTQLMAPELAAKYPEIMTFNGTAVRNPSTTVRIDSTPAGFHAQVLQTGERWFVDPKFKGDTSRYISYQRATRVSGSDHQCLLTDTSNGVGDFAPRSFSAARSGDTLRSYRLAVAATGEYTQFHGGTKVLGMAAIVTTINRVVGIYEKELAVTLQLIGNNDDVVYTNPATDPFTGNNDAFILIDESQDELDLTIGTANYDIGHTFSTGAGGLAGLGVVCNPTRKGSGVTGASNPAGDPFDVDFVAHEIGHQFGGDHTFNGTNGSCTGGNRNGSTAYEPGSGTTIQAYAGICGSDNLQSNSDAIFHSESHAQMMAHVTGSASGCAATTSLTNSVPVANAGPDYGNNGISVHRQLWQLQTTDKFRSFAPLPLTPAHSVICRSFPMYWRTLAMMPKSCPCCREQWIGV